MKEYTVTIYVKLANGHSRQQLESAVRDLFKGYLSIESQWVNVDPGAIVVEPTIQLNEACGYCEGSGRKPQ